MKLTLEELPADLSALDQLLDQHAKQEEKTVEKLKSKLWTRYISENVPQNISERFSEFWKFYQALKTGQVATFDKNAKTPIQIAAKFGYDIFLEKLCAESNANVNAQTSYHWTAVHMAAQYGHLNCLRVLASHNADLNLLTDENRSCLHLATSRGYIPIVAELLSLDSKLFNKVEALSNHTGTALHSALTDNNKDAIRLLLPKLAAVKDGRIAPLHFAAQSKDPEILDLVISAAPGMVNEVDNDGHTPLAWAVRNQSKVAVEKLLAVNALCDVDPRPQTSPVCLAFEIYYTRPSWPEAKEIRNLVLQKASDQGFDLQKLVEPLSHIRPANPQLTQERDQFVNSLKEQAAILSGTAAKK